MCCWSRALEALHAPPPAPAAPAPNSHRPAASLELSRASLRPLQGVVAAAVLTWLPPALPPAAQRTAPQPPARPRGCCRGPCPPLRPAPHEALELALRFATAPGGCALRPECRQAGARRRAAAGTAPGRHAHPPFTLTKVATEGRRPPPSLGPGVGGCSGWRVLSRNARRQRPLEALRLRSCGLALGGADAPAAAGPGRHLPGPGGRGGAVAPMSGTVPHPRGASPARRGRGRGGPGGGRRAAPPGA